MVNDPSFVSLKCGECVFLLGILLTGLITTDEPREREPRLNIPKHLDKMHNISRVTILKAINNMTAVKRFGGRVEINGKKFYLLGSR